MKPVPIQQHMLTDVDALRCGSHWRPWTRKEASVVKKSLGDVFDELF